MTRFWPSQSSLYFGTNYSLNNTTKFQLANTTGSKQKTAGKVTSPTSSTLTVQVDKGRQTPKTVTVGNDGFTSYFTEQMNKQMQSAYLNARQDFYSRDYLSTMYQKSDQELLDNAAYRAKMYNDVYLQKAQNSGNPNTDTFQLIGMGTNDNLAAAENYYTDPSAIFHTRAIQDELNSAISSQFFWGTELKARNTSALNIDLQIENLAAYYAFYQSKAAELYQGADYDRVMKRVDAQFNQALAAVTENFMQDDRYMQSDIAGIRDSIQALFQERAGSYVEALQSEEFQNALHQTDVGWARNSAYFVAAKLRNHVDGVAGADGIVDGGTAAQSAAKYTYGDLQAMALMSFESQMPSITSYTKNEEALGVALGMDAIIMNMLIGSGKMSQSGIDMLKQSFEMEKANRIQELNEYFEWQSADPYSPKGYLYNRVDEKAVDRAIDIMLGALKHDNLEDGIRASIDTIRQVYQDKQTRQYDSGQIQERYRNSLWEMDSVGISMPYLSFMSSYDIIGVTSSISFRFLSQFLNTPQWQVSGAPFRTVDIKI